MKKFIENNLGMIIITFILFIISIYAMQYRNERIQQCESSGGIRFKHEGQCIKILNLNQDKIFEKILLSLDKIKYEQEDVLRRIKNKK